MNCPKCGSKPMDLPWNGWFECGSWKNPVSEDFFHNKICAGMEQLRKPLDAQILQLESERDALQARVNSLESEAEANAWKISPAMADAKIKELNHRVLSLQSLLDQRWEMMRELEVVCETKDVAKAVEYIKGIKTRVKKLEEAGDRMRILCADGDDCDAWDAAKEAKP